MRMFLIVKASVRPSDAPEENPQDRYSQVEVLPVGMHLLVAKDTECNQVLF